MEVIPWQKSVKIVKAHVAKISTPRGHGTCFLLNYVADGALCAVATAAHVVNESVDWEEPVRIEIEGRIQFLRPSDRVILRRAQHDTAVVLFPTVKDLFPEKPLELIAEEKAGKIGLEIGWLGFPAVAPDNLCFFLGRISSRMASKRSYLVDGVAINGVSGGPAFKQEKNDVLLIGIVSAYLPNISVAGTLPGLCIVRHVGGLYDIVREIKSLEEAKKKEDEQPPTDAIGQDKE